MENLSALYKYCKKNNPNVIIYNDENNPKRDLNATLRMRLTFDSIHISFLPNVVLLKGDCGVLSFRYVTKVRIKRQDTLLGDTVIIYCSNNEHSTAYTLILRNEEKGSQRP